MPRHNEISSVEIRRLLGAVSDHTIAEIQSLKPDKDALEAVALRLQQENDVLGDARRPLESAEGRLYDLVLQDELYRGAADEDRC